MLGNRGSLVSRGRSGALVAPLLLSGLVWASVAHGQDTDAYFRRGDTNDDGIVDLSDGISTLLYLFSSGSDPSCLDAADADDNGAVELTDGVYTFSFLFTGGPNPPAPGSRLCGPDPTPDELGCVVSDVCPAGPVGAEAREAGHVLNRLAYGPTAEEYDHIQDIGVEAWIDEQLAPQTIDESENEELQTLVDGLFFDRFPSRDSKLVAAGDLVRYRKGTSEAPSTWRQIDFDDSTWLQGPTGIGYGDGDDATVLSDMRQIADNPETPEVNEGQPGYLSVQIRRTFEIEDLESIDQLILSVSYDDGFVAYLNGREALRASMPAGTIRYNTQANSHEADGFEEFDLTSRKSFLVEGTNVLAIDVHNTNPTSSDLTMIPELVSRTILPGDPVRTIDGIDALQQLVHIRGVLSRRQLQAVLGEFWENHFTTDYDKLVEYFDALRNSDATDAMTTSQAQVEAAQVEYLEYEFFYENALGYFGDLLLFSATSPAMNVYLDNYLNVKGAPNENYAREILELSAFGVDNRYDQQDIEELATAFTGWNLCKVTPGDALAFPESARNPPVECGVQFEDSQIIGLGSGWTYFKGRQEPSPNLDGLPTTAWTEVDYAPEGGWSAGSTGIGYGDGDDATVLSDMRDQYVSVYVRREFTVDDPDALENLILEVVYDDSFVAYLNGVEVGRTPNLAEAGTPPTFDEVADETHEIDDGDALFNLNGFKSLLRPAPEVNVLAFQVHNGSLGSSDLSLRPRLIERTILPGSIENGDPSGQWVFRFVPDDHDTTSKVIFDGTPYEVALPAGRTGAAGLDDALEVIDSMVAHPSTIEFISIKLIQRFVSDGITLANYRDGTAPIELRELLADMQAAWLSTERPGHIETVLRVLFDPTDRDNIFWSDLAFRSKVKTPIEYVNSNLRILGADITGEDLPSINSDLGMSLFTRDDPDGWSEFGFDWIDTGTVLERVEFSRELAENLDADYRWDVLGYMDSRGLDTADKIVSFVDEYLFQGTLEPSVETLLIEFLNTTTTGASSTLDRSSASVFRSRVEEFFGLVLSMPQWQFQ